MGLFGKSQQEKEWEESDRIIREKIRKIEDSFEFTPQFFSCEAYVMSDDDELDKLEAYLKAEDMLEKNEDFLLSKRDLAEKYGEVKIYNYLPVPLDYKISGDQVLIRYGENDYTVIGKLPKSKLKEILLLHKQPFTKMKVYFCGTIYKELTTEDFKHYEIEKDNQTAILITYRKKNPEHAAKESEIKELQMLLKH